MKRILVGYDGHTIYKVYIREKQKVIQIQDLQIFKVYKAKKYTKLLDYFDDMPIFQGFLLEHNNEKDPKSHICQKVNSKREEKQEMPIPRKDQQIDARKVEHPTSKAQRSRKVTFKTRVNAENEPKSLHPYAGRLSKNTIRE